MKTLVLAFTAITAFALPTFLLAQDGEGRRLAEQSFASIPGSDRGWIDQGGFVNAGGDVFAAMDYNNDLKLSLSEFLFFDIGMRAVAEEVGQLDAHETAMRVVFAFYDRDGDGLVSKSEHTRSLNYDFQRADHNDDAKLSLEEYVSGFTIMVALRAAINPAPVK